MLETGALIDGKYKILSEVGQGSMGIVYMAINEKANKTWAVKEVRKDGQLDFRAVRQGLVAETDILKKLHHPNLPSIVDVIDDEDSFLIVMDYIEGNTLYDRLEESGAQPQEDVILWARQLCDVLIYLHSRVPAIIYRDMKPKNIMLKPDGNICLFDFGTAREYKERNLEDTISLGTIGYAAPEQFGGRGQTDARTDIYGLGATMYHLVTGEYPPTMPYKIGSIRDVNPALSSGLDHIIQKCTQENQADRYQTAEELMVALERYEEIDDGNRRKQKTRLAAFLSVMLLALTFLGCGIGFHFAAARRASDDYDRLLSQARLSTDYDEKISYYRQAIAVPDQAGEADAYVELIDTFESFYDEEDSFTAEEEKLLISLVTQNESSLKSSSVQYVEVCFEIGKLYWYYYDCGDGGDNQVTKAKYAVKWFEKVLDTIGDDWDYENSGMARVYSEVGNFYNEVTKNITQGDDAGTYAPFFEDLYTLMEEIASDENEKENVRLELCALAQSALQQYASKFKMDKIEYEEIVSLYDYLEDCLNKIETVDGSTPDEMKKELMALLGDTYYTIQVAYGRSKEEQDVG